MSYWKIKNAIGSNSKFNQNGFKTNETTSALSEFYELEEAVVLDIILDETHPAIQNLVAEEWPDNYKDQPTEATNSATKKPTKNYTYIGRVLFRGLNSQIGLPREQLSWAKPLHSTGIVEFPLYNEVVMVGKYRGEWYYFRKLNINGFTNQNANFNIEIAEGNTSGNRKNDDTNSNKFTPVNGPISYVGSKFITTVNNSGVLGSYFRANNKIRALKKYEGDTSLESRFGQSIRFSSYDSIRSHDSGSLKYIDYKNCGNPSILIRNRQRPLGDDKKTTQLHPLLPPIPVIPEVEKNAGGIIEEDINNDGSSIHITSGLIESKWKTTVYKTIFCQDKSEEQPKYSPSGSTSFIKNIPLNGEQIVINTDRLILSSRFDETLHYSKKRYGVVTDSEYTVDAHDQVVITTNKKTVINSPAIYLGQYDETNEPALLGQTTVDWLYDLCEWLKIHVHLYDHTHPNTGNANPNQTNTPIHPQILALEQMQARLKPLLSRRVFITGGGYANGANGVAPANTDSKVSPTSINISTGEGVPGGFYGKNSRKLNK
jgi:hypothetical protein